MLKLGIILYGITRDQAHVTAPVFHDLIIKPLRDFFEVKIFLHALVLSDCQIDWHQNSQLQKIKKPHDYNSYKADYISFTNQDAWSASFDYEPLIANTPPPSPSSDYVSAKNYINALYSLSVSFAHTNQYPCDLYFVSRLDLLYKNNEGIKTACLDISNNLDKNILYSPSWALNGGLNDRLAIGNSSVAKVYCNRFTNYLTYKKIKSNTRITGQNIHSESMLKRCSEHHKFDNKFFDCKAHRMRINGLTRER